MPLKCWYLQINLKFSLLDVQLRHVFPDSALSVVQGYNDVLTIIEEN